MTDDTYYPTIFKKRYVVREKIGPSNIPILISGHTSSLIFSLVFDTLILHLLSLTRWSEYELFNGSYVSMHSEKLLAIVKEMNQAFILTQRLKYHISRETKRLCRDIIMKPLESSIVHTSFICSCAFEHMAEYQKELRLLVKHLMTVFPDVYQNQDRWHDLSSICERRYWNWLLDTFYIGPARKEQVYLFLMYQATSLFPYEHMLRNCCRIAKDISSHPHYEGRDLSPIPFLTVTSWSWGDF